MPEERQPGVRHRVASGIHGWPVIGWGVVGGEGLVGYDVRGQFRAWGRPWRQV